MSVQALSWWNLINALTFKLNLFMVFAALLNPYSVPFLFTNFHISSSPKPEYICKVLTIYRKRTEKDVTVLVTHQNPLNAFEKKSRFLKFH